MRGFPFLCYLSLLILKAHTEVVYWEAYSTRFPRRNRAVLYAYPARSQIFFLFEQQFLNAPLPIKPARTIDGFSQIIIRGHVSPSLMPYIGWKAYSDAHLTQH